MIQIIIMSKIKGIKLINYKRPNQKKEQIISFRYNK